MNVAEINSQRRKKKENKARVISNTVILKYTEKELIIDC